MSDSFLAIMAPYGSAGAPQTDFDVLVRLVKDKQVRTEGLIVVERDADGQVRVSQTGDHLGHKGLGWGDGVGVIGGAALCADAGLCAGWRRRRGADRQVRRAQGEHRPARGPGG